MTWIDWDEEITQAEKSGGKFSEDAKEKIYRYSTCMISEVDYKREREGPASWELYVLSCRAMEAVEGDDVRLAKEIYQKIHARDWTK